MKIKCDDNEKNLEEFRRKIAALEHKFGNWSDMPYIKEIYAKIRNMASKHDMEAFKKGLDEINNKIKTMFFEVKELKKDIKVSDDNGRYFEEVHRKIAD